MLNLVCSPSEIADEDCIFARVDMSGAKLAAAGAARDPEDRVNPEHGGRKA